MSELTFVKMPLCWKSTCRGSIILNPQVASVAVRSKAAILLLLVRGLFKLPLCVWLVFGHCSSKCVCVCVGGGGGGVVIGPCSFHCVWSL